MFNRLRANTKNYEQTNKGDTSGQICMGAIFERQDMEWDKAAYNTVVLQLRANRLHSGSIQWKRSHTHNYTRLGDEYNKIRICLTASGHN